jgi:hypothetical protein
MLCNLHAAGWLAESWTHQWLGEPTTSCCSHQDWNWPCHFVAVIRGCNCIRGHGHSFLCCLLGAYASPGGLTWGYLKGVCTKGLPSTVT